MRVFQNSGIYPFYLLRLRRLTAGLTTFAAMRDAFLGDRYGAPHFLKPVLDGEATAFFTNGDDRALQRQWARENGMAASASLEAILLAQIEAHRTEVFYNMDPVRYPGAFVGRLPGCVRRSVAWRAAPTPASVDFGGYDLLVCNFPSILASYEACGWRAAYFSPAHDPELDAEAARTDRPIDILFVGGYSRHHRRRAAVLEAVAELGSRAKLALHLDASRATRLAETPPLSFMPMLARHRRPKLIARAARAPLFGRELYRALGSAKIVLNGAVDMAGDERGNMRCWEAMGAGALLVSDAGRYPDGMEDGRTLVTYASADDARARLAAMLDAHDERRSIAAAGHAMIAERYSKARQWAAFQELVAQL